MRQTGAQFPVVALWVQPDARDGQDRADEARLLRGRAIPRSATATDHRSAAGGAGKFFARPSGVPAQRLRAHSSVSGEAFHRSHHSPPAGVVGSPVKGCETAGDDGSSGLRIESPGVAGARFSDSLRLSTCQTRRTQRSSRSAQAATRRCPPREAERGRDANSPVPCLGSRSSGQPAASSASRRDPSEYGWNSRPANSPPRLQRLSEEMSGADLAESRRAGRWLRVGEDESSQERPGDSS